MKSKNAIITNIIEENGFLNKKVYKRMVRIWYDEKHERMDSS